MKIFAIIVATVSLSLPTLSQHNGECTTIMAEDKVFGSVLFQQNMFKATTYVKIPLQRVRVKSPQGSQKSFYLGNVSIGYPPQRLRVSFDTSFGYVLLPGDQCKSRPCMEHKIYSANRSATSVSLNFNGSKINRLGFDARGQRTAVVLELVGADLGSGRATTASVRDKVCLYPENGEKICATMTLAVATNMTDVPFRAMPSDGIVGLGLDALSACPHCNFLERLFSCTTFMSPLFGMSLLPDGGELYVGGYDPTALSAPMQWFPVYSPEAGLWQVEVFQIRVGSKVVFECKGGCQGIIDSSSSRVGVQKDLFQILQAALSQANMQDGSCAGPELEFDIGTMQVKLGSEDYADANCTPDLGLLDVDGYGHIFTFGERVLRQYFIAFNWESKQIGFAPRLDPPTLEAAASKGSRITIGPTAPRATPAEVPESLTAAVSVADSAWIASTSLESIFG